MLFRSRPRCRAIRSASPREGRLLTFARPMISRPSPGVATPGIKRGNARSLAMEGSIVISIQVEPTGARGSLPAPAAARADKPPMAPDRSHSKSKSQATVGRQGRTSRPWHPTCKVRLSWYPTCKVEMDGPLARAPVHRLRDELRQGDGGRIQGRPAPGHLERQAREIHDAAIAVVAAQVVARPHEDAVHGT